VRSARQNAASVASLLITTEAMVVEKAKDEKPAASGHGGGGGMGGMEGSARRSLQIKGIIGLLRSIR
jgi:hypothetical protein